MGTPALNAAPWSAQVPAKFVDRTQELNALAQLLVDRRQAIVQVTGPAGIGKSALAAVFNSHFGERWDQVLYLDPSLWARASAEVGSVAIRGVPRRERALLVVDDIPTSLTAVVAACISRSLQEHPSLQALLVSRHAVPMPVESAVLRLDGLSEDDSVALLTAIGVGYAGITYKVLRTLAGSPAVIRIVASAVGAGFVQTIELEEALAPIRVPGLLGPDGRPIRAGATEFKRIVSDVRQVSDEFLEVLADSPDLLRRLPSRKFEELVAELLNRHGYEVTLTPASGDGGRDVYAAKKDDLGDWLYFVECKRWSRPVGIRVVRELYGVVEEGRATAGILVTTSTFTRGAKEFQQKTKHRVSLVDYFAIQRWLKAGRSATQPFGAPPPS